jgi:hypothetical protein
MPNCREVPREGLQKRRASDIGLWRNGAWSISFGKVVSEEPDNEKAPDSRFPSIASLLNPGH